MSKNKLAYFELPTTNVPALKNFYASLFGWTFQDFGDEYAAFSEGLDGGLNGVRTDRTSAPLGIIETDEIESLQARLTQSGAIITREIFAYPGGRRFHFTDPSGNELAVMQPD